MSSQFRDKPTSESKRHGQQSHHSEPPMPNYLVEAIPSPFSDAARSLSDSELRETAYEILVGACRSSSEKPLTYIPQSERNGKTSASPAPAGSSASLQRSLASTAASKVKKALGLVSSGRRRSGGESSGQERVKRAVTIGDEKDEDAGKVKKKVQLVRGAADGRWVERAIGRGRCKIRKREKRWNNRQMKKMGREEQSTNEDTRKVKIGIWGRCNREAEGGKEGSEVEGDAKLGF